MGSNDAPVSPGRLDRAETASKAFERMREKITAMPADVVGRVTADPAIAASIALGAHTNLLHLRSGFEPLGDGGAALAALNDLPDLAFAAFYTHVQFLGEQKHQNLTELIERARPLRGQLLGFAEGISGFGYFTKESLEKIREGGGNLDLAKDLVNLAALYTSNWERVAPLAPFGETLVAEAAELGAQLLQAIGASEVGEVPVEPSQGWEALRARAFRLLVLAYEELRRAVTYLRWYEGDAKRYVPSLHQRVTPSSSQSGAGLLGGSEPKAGSGAGSEVSSASELDLPSTETSQLGGGTPSSNGVAPGLRGSAPFSDS